MDEVILSLFRWAFAGASTGAAAYVAWHYWATRDVYPRIVWNYAGVVLTLVVAWRWFVIWITAEAQSELYAAIQPWIAPMTQAGYILLSIVIIVLTFTHVKARRRHYQVWHEDDGFEVTE